VNTVFFVGAGDMAERLAHGLAASGQARQIVLVNGSRRVEHVAAALASSYDVTVHAHITDGRNVAELARLMRRHRPDLVVQAASLMSPWALTGRSDPAALAFARAGLAVRLPLQLPILLATMQATVEADYTGPVANLSFPDLTHPLLHRIGLAPTIGLGNVAMYLLRVRAALRRAQGPEGELPLVRVAGQHGTVYSVMGAAAPTDPTMGPWVWVGDDTPERGDDLAYQGDAIAPSIAFNTITAASSLPLLLALLPGAAPLRWSAPGPLGMFGGYPVRIADGAVELDLPDGVQLDDCLKMCGNAGRGDGIERVEADGTVHFTETAQMAVRGVDPGLTEPFVLADAGRRAQRILDLLTSPHAR
jgi:hypothetical protein